MNKIYVMSDIHGDGRHIRNFLTRINNKYDDTDTIILLGDTGTNFFFNKRDDEMKSKLNSFGINLFLVRGNHEERPSICAEKNPNKWHKEPFWGWFVWVENDYPYIKYAMDFVTFYYIPYKDDNSEIETPSFLKTLVIPGAYSVDKYKRLKMGWSWFPQEQLSKSEQLAGLALIEQQEWNCNLVLSHTCPISYEPTDLFLPIVDQSMVEKNMERYLGYIENQLDYNLWLFGHFHDTRAYPKNNDSQMLMLFNDKVIELFEWIRKNNVKQYY